jgi:L-aspartate semialdehyde sulfurtransferase ferredoxin
MSKKKEADAPADGSITRRVYLTFNKELCTRPIIYEIIKKYDVIPNIRTASVTEDVGLMGVEITGSADGVEKALDYCRKAGLKVDPIEMNVVEP